jgi:NAD(P)-dependent dehydrogenase (short-subunit alcohol dehydrogenase family)
VLNTNVVWNYCLAEQAARRMKERGGGSITFLNSNTAYRAIPDRVAYVTSKGGQLGLMRALALDLGKYGIRVNAVLPGMIKTDRWEKNPDFYKNVPSRFTPLGDVAVGEDIADAVFYFAVSARNTTGAELVVDGGMLAQLTPNIERELWK